MANDSLKGVNENSKDSVTDLIAQYGNSSSTAWLEFERYKIWRPSDSSSIPQSSFPPVQGYMSNNSFVFAWGNPLVSDSSALEPTAKAFTEWVISQDLRPVWCCVDQDLELVLAKMGWSTINCIHEDVLDVAHVVELADPGHKGQEGNGAVKDLKKNLRRADKADVVVAEMKSDEWTDEDKRAVEEGIGSKRSKSDTQIASTSLQPWLDFEHRRYWLARKDNKIQGLLILSAIQGTSWQIKYALSFPDAPKGTSEAMIYTALKDLNEKDSSGEGNVTVTFGITASGQVNPVDNISGWRITWLSKTYNKITSATGLVKRGDFRSKFDSNQEPMYVCYPAEDGFGLEGISGLMKLLK